MRKQPGLEVTFRQLGHSKRERVVRFELGSKEENSSAAVKRAWRSNCEIASSRKYEVEPLPRSLFASFDPREAKV